jgi:hypothetical protein
MKYRSPQRKLWENSPAIMSKPRQGRHTRLNYTNLARISHQIEQRFMEWR